MENTFRNCIYQGKNLFRDFGFLFWSLIYPLILASFFHMAFSGIMHINPEDIDVGIKAENPVAHVLEGIEILNIHKIDDDRITEKLDNEEIYAFIDNDLNLSVTKSGINQAIIKEIIEQIKQVQKLNRPVEDYNFDIDYISNKNQQSNPMIVIFYSMIAMFSTYGISAGIETISLVQANLSNLGARINVTPLKKYNFLLSGIIVALLLNLLSNGILIIFIKYILKIELFSEAKYSSIFIVLGNLFGVALGIFIGASNKKKDDIKILIAVATTLILAFFAGMMGPWTKITLDKHVPIINKLNPISIITNNLYRINLLENTKNMGQGILLLSLYSVILASLSYIFLRGRNYDSI